MTTGKIVLLALYLLIFSGHFAFRVNGDGDPGCEQVEQDLEKCTAKFKSYRKTALMGLKQIFAGEQFCFPSNQCEKQVEDERAKVDRLENKVNEEQAKVTRLERRSDALMAGK